MGIHVGVVKVEYLERPKEPIYGFLSTLLEGVGCEDWGGSWDGNAIREISRRRMLAKARVYARRQSLTQADYEKVVAWVKGLPWDGDTIMLHLDW